VRDQRLHQPDRAQQQAFDAVPPVLLGGVQNRARGRPADRQQRAVEAVQPVQRRLDQPVGGTGVAEVGRLAERGRRPAEIRGGRGDGAGVPGADQHPGAVVDQGPGGREPQPPARAGEQVAATAQPQVHQAAEPRSERRTYCMIPPLR
jgi:hypothetical protein